MGTPYVGEIRMFAGNFAPAGWMFCQGQVLPISENETLFNLIGTTYGGDGQSTFALPDLQGRVPVHMGTGAGQTFTIGQSAGEETVTLTTSQIPNHTHTATAFDVAGNSADPTGRRWAASADTTVNPYGAVAAIDSTLSPTAIASTGGSQPHDNMIPFLAINFIISLFGVFPSQT
jgi:microcystin-dependent protein